jgi:hypothetical protein
MNEPTWTTELPSKSGWYWQDEDGHRFIVFVDVDRRIVYDFSRHGWPLRAEKAWGCKWSGPIEPPGRET